MKSIHLLKTLTITSFRWSNLSAIVGVLLLVSFPFLVFSQNYQFKHYSLEDGLSEIQTHSPGRTLEDKDGFMWWATMDGVVRFDGEHFKQFRYSFENPFSLGSNQTTGICQAHDGKIWVGTGSEGIFVFNPTTERFTNWRHDPNNSNSLAGDGIAMLHVDKDGNIWIGNRFKGVSKYDSKKKQFTHYDKFADGTAFWQASDGTVWVGSSRGLAKYIPEQDTFQMFPISKTNPTYWKYNFVYDIAEDKQGRLWVTSFYAGTFVFDPTSKTFTSFENFFNQKFNGEITTLSIDQSGDIWLGGDNVIYRCDIGSKNVQAISHESNRPNSCPFGHIVDLYFDSKNNLWITVMGEGISVLHQTQNPFQTFYDKHVKSFIPIDDDSFMFQTGIPNQFNTYNTSTQQFGEINLPNNTFPEFCYLLHRTPKGKFIGNAYTQNQTYYYDSKTNEKLVNPRIGVPIEVSIKTILENDFKQVYDVYKLLESKGEATSFTTNHYNAVIDKQKRIWAGTDGAGLIMYDLKTEKSEVFQHDASNSQSIASDVMYELSMLADGRIAIATINGLSIYDPEQRVFQNISESDGLAHNQIRTITQDQKENIWISTPSSISCISDDGKKIRNFTEADGLPKGHFMDLAHCDKQGMLYFTMGDKVIRFHPDSLIANPTPPPVQLMDFYIKKERITPLDSSDILVQNLRFLEELDLNYQQSDFGFSFNMPVYQNANQVQYAYRLKGYDDDWNTTHDNFVHYTNIEAGNYIFEVKGITNDGASSPNIASLAIHKSPPFWKTWWAYLLYAISLLGTIYSIYLFNLRRQIEKSKVEQLEEMNELKSHFYTNITHEFRTPLTVIMGLNENMKGDDMSKQLIRRNSKNLLRMVNQLLDISKAEFGNLQMKNSWGDIVIFLQYLTESFYSRATDNGIRLTFYSEEESVEMLFDEDKVQQIIYNLLSNAIKFTEEEGKVIVHVQKTEVEGKPFLNIKIKDNGRGISVAALPHIFDRFYQADNSSTREGEGTGIGLSLVKELVDLMGGKITATSKERKGTEFNVSIPILQNKNKRTPTVQVDKFKKQIAPNQILEESEIKIPASINNEDLPILLIVEDNPDVAFYIQSILEKDYQIHLAKNGQIGIDKAIEITPDIIISDVMMPIKDGYEVCEALKQDKRTSHIPIILLTAKATDSDRIDGLKFGADAYLIKPFDKEELVIRLENLVRIRKQLQQRFANPITEIVPEEELSMEALFLKKINTIIDEQMSNPNFNVVELSKAMQMSRSQLYRKVSALTGQTIVQILRLARLKKAKELLQNKDLNISEIAFEVGFKDPSYFSRVFQQEFGTSPSDLRQ